MTSVSARSRLTADGGGIGFWRCSAVFIGWAVLGVWGVWGVSALR